MGLPYSRRPKRSFSLWQLLLLVVGVVLIVVSFMQLTSQKPAVPVTYVTPGQTPNSRWAVLPTPTENPNVPKRAIRFPAAGLAAPIIESIRTENSWETGYLGANVGHLEGTSWLGQSGNIVLAAHFDTPEGADGPFKYLFDAQKGDLVILQEGNTSVYYRVRSIEHVEPDDVRFVTPGGPDRLTLITCTDWSWDLHDFGGRLIVVADPITEPDFQTTQAAEKSGN